MSSRNYVRTDFTTESPPAQLQYSTVVLKIVPVTMGAAFLGITHGPISVRLSFPTPALS